MRGVCLTQSCSESTSKPPFALIAITGIGTVASVLGENGYSQFRIPKSTYAY